MPTSRQLDELSVRRAGCLARGGSRLVMCVFVVAGTGCGQATMEASLHDLQARLGASERAQADAQKKLDDLDNRMFLLSDQVESQKVALSRHGGEPRLPVITLGPTRGPGGGAELPASDAPAPTEKRALREAPPTGDAGFGNAGAQSNPFDGEGVRHSMTLAGTTTPWLLPETEDGIAESAMPAPAESTALRPLPPGVASLGVAKAPGGNDSIRLSQPATTRKPSAVDATARYRAAYGKLKAGEPERAAEEFRAFVREFPTHDLADNAQYWLGESYYARQSYQEASEEFRTVVRRWPLGNKAPDALLKLGYCLIALGDVDKGRAVLSEVADHYPRTDAAQLATRRLAELPERKP